MEMKLQVPLSIYKALDKDKNGHISIKEMKKSKRVLESFIGNRNSSQKINVKEVFKNLDLNKNGKIEPQEIDKSLEGQVIFRKGNNSVKGQKNKTKGGSTSILC